MVYAIPHLFRIPVGDYGFESTVNSIVELGPGEYMGFFHDNGETWSEPVEMPAAVTGDRHYLKYLPDGRIFMTFRDMAFDSPTQGDWMGWIGTYEDLVNQREGQYRIRIMENERHDCGYAGIEILPDGTIVTTSYGSFDFGKPNYVVSVRFKPEELDEKYKEIVG